MKVTKYNKVYEVSEQEVEKQIRILADMLEMNEDGEYTGPVAAEVVSQEDINKEIKQLKEKIKKLTERDNDTIAYLLVWTEEDAERVRQERQELGFGDLYDELFEDDAEEEVFSKPVE
ncbi:hypothetical protein [Streptococcus oralis]|uniref:Uncharacterized protein n=1 Tax=Streptococcus oralis subsp. oralis TaxID=1891914 RepID=A0A1X1GL33_STROR|nr:hypothetical protein [Streptococcus oralis]ORO47590.1 hypothetical protein B7723_09845 [Streptococcus oralis subsp. oralis]ORO71836.1 hypothetical protein B7712_04055 [Streptococcus oralis subsp. oralis]